jgi:hypothetical protein
LSIIVPLISKADTAQAKAGLSTHCLTSKALQPLYVALTLRENSLIISQGSSGSACTCAATEFHYHNPPLTAPQYAIEVSYFSVDRVTQQFKELLQIYRQHNSEPSGQPSNDTAATSAQRATGPDASWNIFKAAFPTVSALTKEFLLQDDEEQVNSAMSSWVVNYAPAELHAAANDLLHPCRESFADERACKERLRELTSQSNEFDGPARWPYIESVKYVSTSLCLILLTCRRVFVRAHVLSKGLIFVDLPGTTYCMCKI